MNELRYTEVNFLLQPPDPWRDVLTAELGELGFDAFEETPAGVKAYIVTERFERSAVERLWVLHDPHLRTSFTVREMEQRNWNAEWERSFQPVEVGKQVRIRAEFHAPDPTFQHEIVIDPRMAFGTGHHATTRLMMQAMLGLDLAGRTVTDLGCGTAVLAILAERLGAAAVHAIDIDEQAVLNARDNIRRNACERITVEKGDAGILEPLTCGAILANIERNTLLRDMSVLYDALLPGGVLLLSGFVIGDRDRMVHGAREAGLLTSERMNEGEWALLGCRKQ